MSYKSEAYAKAAETVMKKFEKRGMTAFYCPTKEEAKEKILSLMEKGSSITWGGSESMAEAGVMDAIRNGACIVTDTQMAKAGINKRALARYGGEAYCFMSDEDVAALAKKNGTTRATASMDKAAEMDKKLIFAIGNAPTALVRLYELIENGKLSPELIIGVPVGFVNVVQSKELIMHADVPYIVAKGRKGGSNIAACIVNALLYMIDNRRD